MFYVNKSLLPQYTLNIIISFYWTAKTSHSMKKNYYHGMLNNRCLSYLILLTFKFNYKKFILLLWVKTCTIGGSQWHVGRNDMAKISCINTLYNWSLNIQFCAQIKVSFWLFYSVLEIFIVNGTISYTNPYHYLLEVTESWVATHHSCWQDNLIQLHLSHIHQSSISSQYSSSWF